MNILKQAKILGFWGKYQIDVVLNKDVNIFIGKNGTGKTTFINILQAGLKVDLMMLQNSRFTEIYYYLENENGNISEIHIKRSVGQQQFDMLSYLIQGKEYKFPFLPNEFEYRKSGIHPKYFQMVKDLRKNLQDSIQVSWVSVHREIYIDIEDQDDDNYPHHRRIIESIPIDRKLSNLMKDLTSYQLYLETEASKLSKNLQKSVLASMLHDDKFDHFAFQEELKELDLEEAKRGLIKAYQDLGFSDSDIIMKIDNHINIISNSRNRIREASLVKKIDIDDIIPLWLLRRTRHIVDLSTEVENNKKTIFSPIQIYLDLLREFTNRNFELSSEGKKELIVRNNDGNVIPLRQLSSGEKQLLILLTETLLQKNMRCIFIADEPELSLHIEWQREIVSSIRKLNNNSQIILATHSPEIAGKWSKNIIEMENILHA